jgi:hypothetical protein
MIFFQRNLSDVRHVLGHHANIISILFTYFIEAAHVYGLLICAGYAFVLAIGSMPFHLAQLMGAAAWCSANMMIFMGGGISLFKILLVTHFDLVFMQDPERLGHRVLGFAFLVICLPHTAILIYQSAHGVKIASIVSFFMGEPLIDAAEASPTIIFGTFWFVLSMLILVAAKLYIPYKLNQHQSSAIEAGARMEDKAKKIPWSYIIFASVFAVFLIIINVVGQSSAEIRRFPVEIIPAMIAVFICLVLLILIMNSNAIGFTKKLIRKEIKHLRQSLRRAFPCKSSRIIPA